MAAERAFEPLLQQDARALARRVEHRGRLGVMVERLVGPVVHDHREVEVIRADDRPLALLVVRLP
jgi:hypothetical protein